MAPMTLPIGSFRRALCLALGVLGLCVYAGGSLYSRGGQGTAGRPCARSLAVEIMPKTVDLGALAPRESGTASFTLSNPSPEAVVVDRVETSCPCVRVSPASFRLAPGELMALQSIFDPVADGAFEGSLAVDVVGRAAGGGIVFGAKVMLEVRGGAHPRVQRVPSENQ